MDRLTIEETQRLVDEWIHTVGGGYFSELTNMAVLTEEVGELARVISRVYGDQVAKEGDLRKGLAEEPCRCALGGCLSCKPDRCGSHESV